MPPERRDRLVDLGIFAALVLGIAIRLIPVLSSPLPLGDGGLFDTMIEEIRQGGAVPAAVDYNSLGIPFLYPPAAFILAAGVGNAFGVGTLDLLRVLPALGGVATLVVFMVVARRLLPPVAATGATLSYALMPHAFDWVVAGGGLTRGLGLIPALGAIFLAARTPLTVRSGIYVGALLGLSAIFHPQTPVLGAIGCAVFTFRSSEVRRWLRWYMIAGVVAVALSLIWLVPATLSTGEFPLLVAEHRADPLNGLIGMMSLEFSGAGFMDLFTPLAIVGVAVAVLTGAWRLPIFVVTIYLTGAGGGGFMGAVAWSLLAGAGFGWLIQSVRPMTGSRAVPTPVPVGLAVVAVLLSVLSAFGSVVHEQSKLQAVTPDQVAAMRWVDDHTEPGARFLIATVDTWGNDEVSEWFPALAHRQSVGTVQGSEWLGADGFGRQEAVHIDLVGCIGATAACYAQVAIDAGAPHAYLFVPKGQLQGPLSPADCCPALRQTLSDADYQIVYDGPGATIARPAG